MVEGLFSAGTLKAAHFLYLHNNDHFGDRLRRTSGITW